MERYVVHASEVLNAIAFLKNVDTDLPPADIINFVILQLEGLLPDVDEAHQKRLTFIMKQLGLCLKEPKGRRYSPFLIACAAMWLTTSTALYNQLYFKKISSAFRPCVV
jgi:hypothetical protein